MPVGSAGEIVAALADAALYPHAPAAVEHVQTHISHVFLAGPYVYKLKKPVRFSFLDFSTPELRRHCCEEEVRLNRPLAPGVYLDVVPIVRRGGRIALGGAGEVLDHVVWMRRLPSEGMLVSLVARGVASAAMMETLAGAVAAFHAHAATGPDVAAFAEPDVLGARFAENLATARPFVGRLLAAEDHEVLTDFGAAFVRRHETLLRARQRAGRIRDGHGDLHAEHVCFVDAPLTTAGLPPLAPGVYVFDCIEFSRALRSNDVASEVAFLGMDLESLDRPDLARAFVSAYVAATEDPDVVPLLPFYACYRACVRGKVEGLQSDEAEVEAGDRAAAALRGRRHFALALRWAWQAQGPAVIACAGLSGSGKTTVARELAATTGFSYVGTDVLRRRGSGPVPGAYGQGLYTPEARAATYASVAEEVEASLAAGQGVVADGTFIRRADRSLLLAVAHARGRPCVFLECCADEGPVRARLTARDARSPSDARWETYVAQRARREPFGADEPHLVIDTSGDPAAARAAAVRALWPWRQARPA